MRKLFILLTILTIQTVQARSVVSDARVKTLQVVVNDDWLSPPVMKLAGDVVTISFDELSHDYHRYLYRVERCEYDWTPSDDVFESDWLDGFNDNPIEDYEHSLNTTVLYTHYRFRIPNDRCRLRMSGNYRVHIVDEADGREVACAELRVVDPRMRLGLSVSTNTDVDMNRSHQQVTMSVGYDQLRVTNPDEQIRTLVMQNGREDNLKENIRPTHITPQGLRWEHSRPLIFEAGNEYHKFEVLDVSHATMGLERIVWDGERYQAFPFANTPRMNYLYDEDANGAFYVRNSDNRENDRTCDYVYVNYRLQAAPYSAADIVVDGMWTSGQTDLYRLSYDEDAHGYTGRILQKQGYYSYQYLLRDKDGTTHLVPEEGSFFETENRYQGFVYYKGTGDRTWLLVGYQQVVFRP